MSGEAGGDREVRLARLAWPQVREAADRGRVAILPIGAIEQHGPHLPIDTDSYLATRLAIGGAEEFGAVVAPGFSFGCRSRPNSGGGGAFPGTWSLPGSAFMDLTSSVLRAIMADGFRRVLVYSWHMENAGFAYEAAHSALEEAPGAEVVVMEQPFDSLSTESMEALFPAGFPGWPLEHAGVLETSLMHHLRPEAVGPVPDVSDHIEWRPYGSLPEVAPAADRNGILWSATGAGAEAGALAYRDIVGELVDVLVSEFGPVHPEGPE